MGWMSGQSLPGSGCRNGKGCYLFPDRDDHSGHVRAPKVPGAKTSGSREMPPLRALSPGQRRL